VSMVHEIGLDWDPCFLEDILIRYYSYSWIFSKDQIYIAYIYILFFNIF